MALRQAGQIGREQHGVRKGSSLLRGGRDEEHARHNEVDKDKGEGRRWYMSILRGRSFAFVAFCWTAALCTGHK